MHSGTIFVYKRGKIIFGLGLDVFISLFFILSVCLLWFWILTGEIVVAQEIGAPPDQSPLAGLEYVDNQLIIKFADGISENQKNEFRNTLNLISLREFSLIKAELVEVSGMTVEEAVGLALSDPRIQYAEPNYVWHMDIIPDDPDFDLLWGMHNTGQTGGTPDADIDAVEAWNINTGNSIIIGVIDTGVDTAHVDLQGNIWTNPREIPDNGIDDDSNGYVDDIHGWDFVNWDNGPIDDNGHGTHCSGTIAGVGNNAIGVAGVCWSAKIMALKFLDSGGYGSTSDAILAVQYATMMGANLTSNSWGGGSYSQALYNAISASAAQGMLFVAAAGNSRVNNDINPHYPSSYDLNNIISVAATDHNDQLADEPTWGSNWGLTSVDLGAPGVSIYSTIPGSSYGYKSGTSMATPHVAGAVALIWSEYPTDTHLEVKDRIMLFVDPLSDLTGKCVTGGRLNVFLTMAEPDSIPPAPVSDLGIIKTEATRITLSWTAPGDDSTAGTAAYYDLRYSESPISEFNFDYTPQAFGEPQPQPAGSTETYVMTGLDFNTTYYFAVKTFDEWNNPSELSNTPSVITLGPPEILVTPDSLSDSLYTNGTSSKSLNIANLEEGELFYEVDVEFPATTRASGKIVLPPPEAVVSGEAASNHESRSVQKDTQFDIGGERITGATKDVLLIYADNGASALKTILEGYPDMGVVDTWYAGAAGGSIPSLADLENYDVVVAWNNQSWKDMYAIGNLLADFIDNGGAVVTTVDCWSSGSFASHGRYFDQSGYSPFQSLGGALYSFRTMGWYDAAHPIMEEVTSLSITSFYNNVAFTNTAVRVAEWDNGTPLVGTNPQTVAINVWPGDGYYWSGDFPTLIHNAINYLTGTFWLWVSPDSGEVAPYSDSVLDVNFDGENLPAGDHQATILVKSNDPDESLILRPVYLHVIDSPDLAVDSDSIDFDIVYIGYPESLPLLISNQGTANLAVTDITTDLAEFSVDITSFSLTPGQDTTVNVTFTPGGVGELWSNLTISSDDPDESTKLISLYGHGVMPPIISVSPDSLSDSLLYGETSTHWLTIANNGISDLNFYILPELTSTTSDVLRVLRERHEQNLLPVAEPTIPYGDSAMTVDARKGEKIGANNSLESIIEAVATMSFGDDWESRAPMEQARGQHGLVAHPDGKIYAFGGYAGSTPFSSLEIYDPATDSWSSGTNMPYADRGMCVAADDYGNIYYFGALQEASYRYEPPSDTWISISPPPYAGTWEAGATKGLDGKIYLIGGEGSNSGNPLNSVQIYDPNADSWSLGSPMPTARYQLGVVTGPGGFVYAIGGRSSSGGDPLNIVEVYDPVTDTWSGAAPMPTARNQFGVSLGRDNKIYAIGGKDSYYNNSGTFFNVVEIYDAMTDTWETGPALPTERGEMDAVVSGNGIYVIGGTNGSFLTLNQMLETWGWLSVDPVSNTITGGFSQDIRVTFNARGIEGDDYRADLVISNNDPAQPEVRVPAHLHVTDVPDIAVNFDSLDFGLAYIGYPESLQLVVSNQGTDSLAVSDITVDLTEFSVDVTSFALAPHQDTLVNVTFAPTTESELWSNLTIVSDDPDESSLTVVLHGEGIVCPEIWADADTISDSLLTGEISTQILTVGNSGGSPLYLELELDNYVEPPPPPVGHGFSIEELLGVRVEKTNSYDPDARTTQALYETGQDGFTQLLGAPGDVLTSWPAPSPISGAWGLGFDGHDVWISDYAGLTDNEVSTTGVLLSWFSCSGWVGTWPGDMAWDGQYIWQVNVGGDNGIYQLDPTDGTVLSSIHDPGHTWDAISQRGLAYDKREDVFYIGGWNQDIVYKIKGLSWDNPGAIMNSFYFPSVSGLAWHPRGTLWISVNASTDYIFQVDPETGDVLSYFLAPGAGSGYEGAGLAVDRSGNLWCISQVTQMIYLVESGVPAYTWLEVIPEACTLGVGETQDFEVKFDATDVFVGDHSADIIFTSNDCDQPSLTIPALLHITGVPDIAVNFDSLDFGEVGIGFSKSLPLLVSNPGTDKLTVTNITTGLAEFSVDITNFTLELYEDTVLNVTFAPTAFEQLVDTLSINSDDPDEPVYQVHLTGSGRECPDIAFNPDIIGDSLLLGETSIDSFFLKNIGLDSLEFVFIDFVSSLLNEPANLGAGGPDSSGYTWIDSDEMGGPVFNFIDITSVGTPVSGLADDNFVGPFPIGFSFPFYDSSYTEFYIQSNGLVNFDSQYIKNNNQPIPRYDKYANNFLAWCWDDLDGNIGQVYYQQFSNRLIIQFSEYGEDGDSGTVDAEVIIYPTGNILFQYSRFNDGFDISSNSVGIENFDGTDGLQVAYDTTYLHDNLAILISRQSRLIAEVSPVSGKIAPDDSTVVEVIFSTEYLTGGDYLDSLQIQSNDCGNPDTFVSVYLHVTGVQDIAVPETLDFGPVFTIASVTETLFVYNEGTGLLTVTGLSCDNSDYTLDTSSFSLNPWESHYIPVTFTPSTDGIILGNVTVQSDDPDESSLTVVLHGEGIVCPEIWADADTISDSLLTGDISTQILTVGNSGGSPLYLEIELDNLTEPPLPFRDYGVSIEELLGVRGDKTISYDPDARTTQALYETGQDGFTQLLGAPGDVLTSWPAPSPISGAWGLGFDGHEVWISDYTGLTDNEVSTTGVLLSWFSCSGWVGVWPGDMAWDGQYIWQVNVGGDNGIYQLDPTDGTVLSSIHDPGHTWDAISQRGLAYDKREDVFYIGGWNQDIVYKIKGLSWDNPGAIMNSFYFSSVSGLAWHPRGTLWISVNASTDYIFQVDPETGDVLSYFLAPGAGSGYEGAGLAMDRSGNLWCISQVTQMIYLVESGVPAYTWLEVIPEACTLGVGETQEFEVKFDAAGLFGGDYSADIITWSNDCYQPSITISALLHVTAAPDIAVSPDSLDFGIILLEDSITYPLTVSNEGADSLFVIDISSDNADFTVDTTSFILAPGEDQNVFVCFTASSPGAAMATLTIVSDDPDEPTITIFLTGEGIVPPNMTVIPDFLSEVLMIGQVSTQFLTISNTGVADLIYNISVDKIMVTPVLAKPFLHDSEEKPAQMIFGKAASQTQGIGEWLYQSEAGVPLRVNDGSGGTELAYPKAYRWKPDSSLVLTKILIYADDFVHTAPNTFVDQALQHLQLAYTAHYEGDWAGFLSDLFSQPWDLVIFANEYWFPPNYIISNLYNYVYNGGHLVFQGWTIGSYSYHSLWSKLGFTWIEDDLDPPDPVYWWEPGDRVFNNPEVVPEFVSLNDSIYGIYGVKVEPLIEAEALAGYTTPDPDSNQAVIIRANDDHTVFKGFLDGQNNADLNSDAMLDGVELWINLIENTSKIRWLSVDPVYDTIPGASSKDVNVIFNATEILGGDYSAYLNIFSNDPVDGQAAIFVQLRAVERGDANGDFTVGIADAVFLLNCVLKTGPLPDPFEAGDLNCDGAVDIVDVIVLVDYLFKGGPAPCNL